MSRKLFNHVNDLFHICGELTVSEAKFLCYKSVRNEHYCVYQVYDHFDYNWVQNDTHHLQFPLFEGNSMII